MPVSKNHKTKKTNATTLDNIRIRRTKTVTTAPMLTQKVAPAGIYTPKIIAVTMSKTEGGEDAIDVTYELTSANEKVAQGRLRYTLDGFHFERFSDAMIDAGVPDDSPITDAVGVTEEIEIAYPQKGCLAKIKTRRPLDTTMAQKPKSVSKPAVAADDGDDEDDEYDDILLDDEEENF